MNIDKIVAGLGLPEQLQDELKEAWLKSVEDNKAIALKEAKQEISEKYEADLESLIKASDALIRESLKSFYQQHEEEKQTIKESQRHAIQALRGAKKLKAFYEKKAMSKVEAMQQFIFETLKAEVSDFNAERKELRESVEIEQKKLAKERIKLNRKAAIHLENTEKMVVNALRENMKTLNEDRQNAKRVLAEKVEILEAFTREQLMVEVKELNEDRKKQEEKLKMLEAVTVKQLTKEITEFQQEKKNLAEQKVQLKKEFEQRLVEAKTAFINKATVSSSKLINKALTEQIRKLKTDILEARKNMFGRQLFESFVVEFLSSNLIEGTEIDNIKTRLSESEKTIEKYRKIIQEKDNQLNNSKKVIAESKVKEQRGNILNKLLIKIGDTSKRNLMESMLEDVKTSDLEKQFNRYFDAIMTEDRPVKTKLSESQKNQQAKAHAEAPKVVIDGSRKQINESRVKEDVVADEDELLAYIAKRIK